MSSCNARFQCLAGLITQRDLLFLCFGPHGLLEMSGQLKSQNCENQAGASDRLKLLPNICIFSEFLNVFASNVFKCISIRMFLAEIESIYLQEKN